MAQTPKRKLLAGFGITLNDHPINKSINTDDIKIALSAFIVVSLPTVGPTVSNASSLKVNDSFLIE